MTKYRVDVEEIENGKEFDTLKEAEDYITDYSGVYVVEEDED